MSLRSQQRKAMVLSVLMVMLAQSAYSQYYQGWYPPVYLEESPEVSYVNPVTCASETRTAGTAIYVDGIYGDDSYAGTSTCPMKTLSGAVDDAVANDEIIMQSGLYHDNVSIDGIDNLEIRAATGATVIFDGTRSITEDLGGVWGSADSDGIQEVTLTQDGWQLFLAHEEQVPARWPNAKFSDDTVFNRSYMAEGTLTNSNNAYTKGWLTDAGPETGVHTGLNETINATGLDPVGAIAVMNLGSFRSNSREITGWNASNGTFSYDGTGVGWKSKHHAYFLEGKRELIDVDGEWWYNNTDNTLHYKTPTSQDANDLDLRVKVQPFAISVDNSDGVTIQGIDFFGTTVNFNNCDGCSFTNSTLQYPSTSKRGLGIAGESEDDRWMTRFYRCKNTFVDKISITNTDGGALEFHGSGGQSHNNTVNNSYFHAIDWSAADQKGLMTTIYEGGRDMHFTNNSVHLTGASSVLSIGDAPKVFYNRVWDVGHLQTDGAVVQVMQGEAPGAEIAYNWIHDVIKYGARFDAPIGQAGEGRNGTMHHNVIWNAAGGLMVKGDYHNIHNNTVFNSTGKNDIIFLTDGGINNKNSTLHNNAVDAMADHRSDDVFDNPLPNGSHWNNWNGYLQGYDGMFEARNQISCAIYDNGSLYCWGRNDHGQLGLGSTSGREDAPQFVDFGTGRTVTSLGMGSSGAEGSEPNSHTCAVLDNGSLMCWGANGDGQLGIGNVSANGVWEPTFVNVGSGVTVISVATASSSSCALLSNQSVKCWGRNNFGQLGLGNISNNDVLTPHYVNFTGSSKPVSLHAGMNSYCAKLDNGSITCWGRNTDGELGLGNTTNQNTPVTLSIPAGRTVATVDLGKRFMCLSYDNGSVACVGINAENQLGQGGIGVSQSSLLYVNGIEMMVQRVDVAQQVACAHLVNGSVVCWGEDEWGLFGNSSSSYTSRTASTATEYVNFGTDRIAASISVSMRHSCAVLDNGDLTCWGRNHKSQLGLGNITQQFMPVVVTNVSTIRQVQIHEMLVDPANNDFRPKWGSHLQQLSAGAYDADDSNPWTAGISWTYTTPNAPVAGCMIDYADNYDSNAIVSDGSCKFSSYTPSSSLDLRLHVDPANSGSYSGSGTDLVDLSTYGNDGTIDGAAWEANRTRFYYDGSCSGATEPANQAGTYVCDEVTFSETNDHDPDANGDWSVSVWMNATTVQHSVIIGKWNGGGSASDLGYIIRIGSDNKLYTSVGTTSGSSAVSTSRISIDEDRWYHLVMVADAGNMLRLYADGVNVVNASLSGSGSIRNTTSGISIGSYNAGEYNQPFDGNIGEVMIFADALNSTTINQMYNASKGAYSNTTSLSYSDSSYTFVKGQPYNLPLGVSNGDVTTSYTLAGSLPTGMNFGSSNGTIWGTPTTDMTSTTYTVTANNSAGSFSTTFSMQIMSAPSGITYSPSSMTLEKGTAMTTNTPTYSGSTVTSWSISPSLPSGLSIDASTGAISGTPSVLQTSSQSYTVTATNGQGSATTSISIIINDQVPTGFSYSPENLTLTNNTASSDLPLVPSLTGSGAITSWTLNNTNLPTGLSFGSSNGTLYGTATQLWTTTAYKVWANNSGGSVVAYFNLTVNDQVPTGFSYSPENVTLTNNTASFDLPLAPTITGSGTITSWELNNTNLPTGISFGSSNGTLYGTATQLWTTTAYKVWANNSGGSVVAYFNLTVNDQVPSGISYSPENVTLTNNTASSDLPLVPSTTGSGTITSWELNNTNLPTGISFGSTNGTLYGTATQLWTTTSYKVWANNTGGSVVAYFNLTVNDQVPTGFSYSPENVTLTNNTASNDLPLVPSVTGSGAITSWAINASLPSGLSFGTNNGTIYGTPTELWNRTSYKVWANNTGGSIVAYFNLTVNDQVPTGFSYSPKNVTLTNNTASSDLPLAPTITGSGAITSWTLNNTNLPTGISFGSSNGTLYGTATQLWTTTAYKVWANNSGGSVVAYFNLTVNDQVPTGISYTPENVTLTNNTASNDLPLVPSVTGSGAITSWAINASLPSGLSFGTNNGTIYGTPTELQNRTTYKVWANNTGGSIVAYFNLTVNDQVPTVSYSATVLKLTNNTASSDLPHAPTITGSGVITSWEINATLPSGLSFGSNNGTIYGIPTELWPSKSYTIWGNNSGGTTASTVSITVYDQVPTISYNPENLTLVKDTASTDLPLTPAISGSGIITSWELNNTNLPTGISFGSSNGTLYGTAAELWTRTAYKVWANNTGGSVVAYFNLTVNDQVPSSITYAPENVTLTNDTASSDLPLVPSITGSGSITSWELNNTSLPSGISFGSSNGTLYGTATQLWARTSYKVWANNTGGSVVAYFNLTVNDQVPTLSYSPENLTLTINNQSSDLPLNATVTGSGAITSWAISPTLPSGLSFGTSNGTIWGTPTSLMTLKAFTIWANNSGGSVTATVNITVNDEAPDISYNPDWFVLTSNVDMSPTATPNNAGGDIPSTIIQSSGVGHEGTSIAIDSNGSIHISYYDETNKNLMYATNEGGSWSNKSIDSRTDAGLYSSIAVDSNDNVHIVYVVSSDATPTGNILSYATCSSSCATSSWTKTDINRQYTWDRRSFDLTIDSNDNLHFVYIKNYDDLWYVTCSSSCSSSSSWSHRIIDAGDSYSPSIALSSNGRIHISYQGDSTKDLKHATCYSSCSTSSSSWTITTVEAGNYSSGSSNFYGMSSPSIGIDSNGVKHIAYIKYTRSTSSSGTSTYSYTYVLKYARCSSSYCTSASSWTNATIDETALNSYQGSLEIDSNDNIHIFYRDHGRTWNHSKCSSSCLSNSSWFNTQLDVPTHGLDRPSMAVDPQGNVHIPITSYDKKQLRYFTFGSSAVFHNFSISPDLPSGMKFDGLTGEISGRPYVLMNNTTFTITVSNSGGVNTTTITIEVIDQVPIIAYSPQNLTLTKNQNSTNFPLTPTKTGSGTIVSWEINATLPSGISFGSGNGTLWGVPTELWPQASYMVWGNNSGGTAIAYLNITVVDELPTLSYFPENLTLLNNTQSPSLPMAPTLNGSGIILEWGISPDLPSGLSFGSDNGTIWGVPTERMNTTMFTIWANNSGGSITANINITVLHQYPAFNYSVLDLMLVNNTAMTNVTSTVTGGEIVSWEVSPAMPVGILIDENGNISGLPTEVQNRTMYMVWANNTAGSHIVYINITIYDIIATLEYVPENITLTRNVTMTDLTPTHTGIIDSWAIWPALPDGLNFTNGTISGTPEYNMTRTNYTVYANNTGGSISHMINITIVEPVMDFEYIPYNVTLINNTASSEMPMVPILYNDGVAETWEIWPALPSGLNFSSTNGTISGIATELQVIPVNYTIWANNSGGVGYAIISITVIDQLPNLTYPGDLVLMNNTNSSDLPMLPVLEGPGEIVTWEISHELPAGLNFSSENGTISGIATELMVKTQYTVWANNSGGSSMAMFNVTVVDQVPDAIGYNHLNMVLTKNENNSDFLPLTPNLVGAGNITSWEINGTLPAGLFFGTENGTIWGIPTELYHEWQYLTIYANNSGGTVISNISIMVNDQIPTIAYNLTQIVLKNDTEMLSIEAIHGGGPFVTVAIHPELPAGMYFGYDNATIWGHPTELTSKIEYTIWANNSGGSASTTINITVEDNIPTFEYTSTEFAFYVDTEMENFPLTVISTGGEIQNFSITPQLPEGLSFGELNGTIWGVATEDISETTFTITAYNPLGDYSIDVEIAVYDYLYDFELDPVWISNDSFMPKITPTYIIPGATYSIGPALPEGMSVNPYTGVVSGRPNGTMQLTSFTLIASVDGYTLSVPMKLGVIEDTDKDGLPDEIPAGGNALNLVEDPDDDNDNVEDQVEVGCGSDPLDADDYPEFNSNGNCAPEPEGIGFLLCLPIILLLLLVLVAIIALWKKKDAVEVVNDESEDGEDNDAKDDDKSEKGAKK